jgi:hypothetical protein
MVEALRFHANTNRRLHRGLRQLLEQAAEALEAASPPDNFEDLERTTRLPQMRIS